MALTIDPRSAALNPPEARPLRIPGQPGRFARYEGLVIGAASVIVFVLVWQIVAYLRVFPELFLPGPADITNAGVLYVRSGQIWKDVWISGQELVYGFGLATAV